MANNKSIQILRGNASAIANNADLVLLDGQPLYDKDNHNLYIGTVQQPYLILIPLTI